MQGITGMALPCKGCTHLPSNRHFIKQVQPCALLRAPNGEIMASRSSTGLTASSSSPLSSSQNDARNRSCTVSRATGDYAPSAPEMPSQGMPERMGEAARKALRAATRAMTRYGEQQGGTHLVRVLWRAMIFLLGHQTKPMH